MKKQTIIDKQFTSTTRSHKCAKSTCPHAIAAVSEAVKKTINNNTKSGKKKMLIVLHLVTHIYPSVSHYFSYSKDANRKGYANTYIPQRKISHLDKSCGVTVTMRLFSKAFPGSPPSILIILSTYPHCIGALLTAAAKHEFFHKNSILRHVKCFPRKWPAVVSMVYCPVPRRPKKSPCFTTSSGQKRGGPSQPPSWSCSPLHRSCSSHTRTGPY